MHLYSESIFNKYAIIWRSLKLYSTCISSYTFQIANEFEQILKETKKPEGNGARQKGKVSNIFVDVRNKKISKKYKILNTAMEH